MSGPRARWKRPRGERSSSTRLGRCHSPCRRSSFASSRTADSCASAARSKIQADVRLLFATLRPLDQEVRAARFRADLFYRIQGIPIDVPPLRERQADIPPLLEQFVAQFSALHGTEPPRLSRGAKGAILAYGWPGNVRELRNAIETVCSTARWLVSSGERPPRGHAERARGGRGREGVDRRATRRVARSNRRTRDRGGFGDRGRQPLSRGGPAWSKRADDSATSRARPLVACA